MSGSGKAHSWKVANEGLVSALIRALPICFEGGPWKMPLRCTFKEGGVVPAAELCAQGQLTLRQIQAKVDWPL